MKARNGTLRLLAAVALSVGTLSMGMSDPAFADTGLTVTPSTGLVDRQPVTVKAFGFPAGSRVYILECAADFRCSTTGRHAATVAHDGTVSVAFTVLKSFYGVNKRTNEGSDEDCTRQHCGIVVTDAKFDNHEVVPISFAS